jgi:hypothetical protein
MARSSLKPVHPLHISPHLICPLTMPGCLKKKASRFAGSRMNNLELNTIYRIPARSPPRSSDLCNGKPDILVLECRTIFSTDILGGIIKRVIHDSTCDVLIFNERNFNGINSILIVYFETGRHFSIM